MDDGQPPQDRARSFEAVALPHLDAAYNLARWITHNHQDAQDVIQDAYLKALSYFDSFDGRDARPWLLQTVRHAAYSWLAKNRPKDMVVLDHDDAWPEVPGPTTQEPEAIALCKSERTRINAALATLPVGYRDVLILREMEELPYRDIARIAGIPIGTVMSRLARARRLMRAALSPGRTRSRLPAVMHTDSLPKEPGHEHGL
jgi:RNA polymerase sigma-70 factor (ECF subfamily)